MATWQGFPLPTISFDKVALACVICLLSCVEYRRPSYGPESRLHLRTIHSRLRALDAKAMLPPHDRRSGGMSHMAIQMNDVGANSSDRASSTIAADSGSPLMIGANEGRTEGAKEAGNVPLLFCLARCGDAQALEAELSALAAKGSLSGMIDQKNGSGMTPLHLAAVYGHAEAVMCLLRHKADVDIADEKNGDTPLHLAVLMGHLSVATVLVRAGAQLCKKNKENMMPVSYIVRHDSHSMLHLDQNTRSGGDHNMLERLLQHFPTFCSVSGHWRDSVIMTRKPDARASLTDKHNKTILHYAARYGQSSGSISRVLNCWASCGDVRDESVDYNSFLAEAVDAGNAEAVKAMRSFGFLPPDQPSNYAKLLSCALLAGGAQAEEVSSKSREVLQELLELGIPSGLQDPSSLSINSLIMERLKDELMKSSIDYPDQAQAVHPRGYTNKLSVTDVEYFESSLPIYLALYAKRYLAFEFMLERAQAPGVTVNQWDEKHKRTCLHWAVEHGRSDIVAKLLRMGEVASQISPSIEDTDGKTALQRAFESKQEEVRRLMLEAGPPAFRAHEEKLFRDREVYVGVVNAILVGAVLVASVTYAGWLQPPAPSPAEFGRRSSKVFWTANSLAFFLAVATVFVTVGALLPTPKKYVGGIVKQLRGAMVLAASILATSLVLVLVAFSAAGFAAIPRLHDLDQKRAYQASMTWTISLGVTLCTVTIVSFAYQLYNLLPSLANLAQSLHCGPLLSTCAGDPHALVGRVGSSTRAGYPNVPSSQVHDLLNRPVAIRTRQHVSSSSSITPRIAVHYG